MLEKKQDFNTLLGEIGTINIDHRTSCKNDLDKLFQYVKKNYLKTQYSLAIKLEEMKIISDILDPCYNGDQLGNSDNDSFKLVMKKVTDRINNHVYFEMRESMIPFNLEKGKFLYGQGRIDEALDAWEEVLKINPDNSYIHSKMLEIRDILPLSKFRANELLKRYQFKYIGSFGHNIMKRPISIITADSENALLVSDEHGDQIHKFSFYGEYLGPLSVRVKKPLGLFKDTDNNIWICDAGNYRLLALNADCKLVEEISINRILHKEFELMNPVYGRFINNKLYLLLESVSCQKRMLVSFDRYNLDNSLDVIPTDMFQGLNVFEFLDHQLYVCDWVQCDLFAYNDSRRDFKRIGCRGIPYPFRRFVVLSELLFLSAGEFIAKLSPNGQTIFTVHLSKNMNTEHSTPIDLLAVKEKDINILFVTDVSLGCIHKFVV